MFKFLDMREIGTSGSIVFKGLYSFVTASWLDARLER
jgi:hypothetical protein